MHKEIEKETPPLKDRGVPNEGKMDLEPKWNFQEGESVTDKDTKQWVDEQNKFWEEQKGNLPRKFEPKTPVRILQRGKQSTTVKSTQAPRRPRGDRYAQ